MSLSQLMAELAELVGPDPDALALITEIHDTARRTEPEFSADAVEHALDMADWREMLPSLLDDLEKTLKRFFTPDPNQTYAFGTDMKRWFQYMRGFVEIDRLDGAKDLMTFYWKIFHRDGKKICGAVRSRCVKAGTVKGACMNKLGKDHLVCSECGLARTFCRKKPMPNGRCGKMGGVIGHGGNKPKGALAPSFIDGRHSLSRGSMFAKQMKKKPNLQRMYLEALNDPDYLSLVPEIALLSARRGQLLAALDVLDPQEIESEVRAHVRDMVKAIGKDNFDDATFHAVKIENLLETGKDNRDRWREMNHIAGQMARISDVERKRIVEARRSVPIEEMINLQNETIKAVRNAINSGAEVLYNDIMREHSKGNIKKFRPEHIRGAMLRHLAAQLRPIQDREQAALAEYAEQDAAE